MIYFLHPLYFLLIIPIILFIILLYFKWWKKIIFWPIQDLKTVFETNSYYYKIYIILLFFILLIYISIFSKPVITDILEKESKNWIDIQIVLDISYSMIAEDLKPNRLEVAKDVISDFLNEIHSDRVWIIVFAWKTFTSLPLNFDYNIIRKIVEKISINTINQNYNIMQWTAVWDALILATDTFGEDNDREEIIILLTDWEANRWLDPMISLKYIKEKNPLIKVYTIWIWWNENTSIVIKNIFWETQELPISWVDEKTLKIIANETNWKYYRASDEETFKNIFTEISKLERKELVSETIKINKEKYNYFIYTLIVLFYLLFFLKNKKRIF